MNIPICWHCLSNLLTMPFQVHQRYNQHCRWAICLMHASAVAIVLVTQGCLVAKALISLHSSSKRQVLLDYRTSSQSGLILSYIFGCANTVMPCKLRLWKSSSTPGCLVGQPKTFLMNSQDTSRSLKWSACRQRVHHRQSRCRHPRLHHQFFCGPVRL